MRFKIISLVIIVSTFSFAQMEDYEELFKFSFGSSKEKVKKIWQETSYSKFGDLVQTSDDTLQIRIDDFKYFDGWKFLFISDSLYKIQMSSKIIKSNCRDAIEYINTNYGEPKITSGDIYYWWYKNANDSTINKISLSCMCFFCESLPDSARLVIGIKNDKLYKRVGDLTVNKEFLSGIINFKWKSSSENITNEIVQSHNIQLLTKQEKNLTNEKSVYSRYGYFANFSVDEWCFTFYYNKLYKIEMKFDLELLDDENLFFSLFNHINTVYGRCLDDFSQNRNWYSWYYMNFDEQQSILGKIYLEKNDLGSNKSEVILTFEYLKRGSFKEQ